MSNELARLAWKVRIPQGRKLVLLALADMADDDGVCWPGRDTLAEMAECSPSSVSRHLGDLIEDGLIEQRRRHHQSATYRVVQDRLQGVQDVAKQDVSIQDVAPATLRPRTRATYKRSKEGTTKNPQSSANASNEHPEASKLCDRLAELMVDNGCKRPDVGKRWLDAARLLLTRDDRPFPEALAVLEWSQADDFEAANVHSLPKFRARYDQLRLKAQKAGALTVKATAPTTVEGVAEWLRKCWADAAVRPIEQAAGLRYEQPDLPLDVTSKAAAADYFRDHRRDWISQHHEAIVAKLTRSAA